MKKKKLSTIPFLRFSLSFFAFHVFYDGTGNKVFVHGAAMTPLTLIDAMTEHGKTAGLKNIEVCHIHTEGPALYTKPDCEGESSFLTVL